MTTTIDLDYIPIPDEVCDRGGNAVEIYLTSKGEGQSDSWALMCALRSPPGLKGTDSINFRGVAAGNPFPDMPESLRQHYIKQCKSQGIDFNGKVYKTGLVRKGYGGLRMDPQALVDSTSSVKSVLDRNGWGAEGMVNRDADNVDAPDFSDLPYQVADDIVDEHCASEVIQNHGGRIKKKDYGALREKVKAKLKGGM